MYMYVCISRANTHSRSSILLVVALSNDRSQHCLFSTIDEVMLIITISTHTYTNYISDIMRAHIHARVNERRSPREQSEAHSFSRKLNRNDTVSLYVCVRIQTSFYAHILTHSHIRHHRSECTSDQYESLSPLSFFLPFFYSQSVLVSYLYSRFDVLRNRNIAIPL